MSIAVVNLPEIAATFVDKYENAARPSDVSCHIQGSNAWWYRTFLKYDVSLIPSGANIVSATLHVYCCYWNDYAASGTTNIARVMTDWTEESVTNWSNQPSFASTAYLSNNVSPPSVGEWSNWDITSLVKEWQNGTPNYGLYIKNNNEGSYRVNWMIRNRRYNNGSHASYISVEYEPIPVFKSRGAAKYEVPLTDITSLSESLIEWSSNTPTNTSVVVETSIDNETWTTCISGNSIPSLIEGEDYHDKTLSIRVVLQTDNENVTPSVYGLKVIVYNSDDSRLFLTFNKGKDNSIQNAIGDISIKYGGGTLKGEGGAIAPFEISFVPIGLIPNNSPHNPEHIEISDINTIAKLSRIYYYNTIENEHIELSDIIVTPLLRHIDDI